MHRRFQRLFSCLLVPLVLVSCLFALPTEVRGDEGDGLDDEFALLEDEEQVFSAAKHLQHVSESPAAITVITRERIENSACSDILCLLRAVPEVEVWRMLPFYHVVGARSLTDGLGDKGLVLIDGREESIEAFGFPIWSSLPVHLEDIERIEIIRGPGSALYGANAHSLVVSITTRAARDNRAEVYLAGGEEGRFALHARVDQVVGDWRLQVSGGRERAESWQFDDTRGLNLLRLRMRADRDWGQGFGKSSLQAGMVSSGGQVYTSLAPITLKDSRAMFAMLEHKRDPITARVWFNAFDTEFDVDLPLAFMGIEVAEIPPDLPLLTTTLDAEVQANFSFFESNLLVAGANYRWLALFDERNDPAEVNQHRVGVFVQDEQRLFDAFTLSAGLRLDYNNITDLALSPRGSLVWRFAADQVLRASGGLAFRKPSFYNTHMHITGVDGGWLVPELGDFVRRAVGTPDLGNESVGTVELGYRGSYLEGRLVAEAGTFANFYRDRIEFNADIAYDEFGLPVLAASSMNFTNDGGEVNTYGGSISLQARPLPALRLDANYTYRYSVYVSEPAPGEAPGAEKGDRVPWVPCHLANVAANYRTDFGLRMGASLHFHSSSDQEYLQDGDPFNPWILVHTDEAVFTNAYLSWRFAVSGARWIELGVKATNLFDQRFTDSAGVTRGDGQYIGGEEVGRLVQVFMRGRL